MTVASFLTKSHDNIEDWKYTNLAALLGNPVPETFSRDVLKGCQALAPDTARLVFLNGVLRMDMSHLDTLPSCLILGDAETGYTLTLGEQTCLVAQPVELVLATNEEAVGEVNLKFTIQLGKHGRLSLLENHLANTIPTTVDMTIDLHPHAKFVHGKILRGGIHLASQKVTVGTSAYYDNITLIRQSFPARNEIDLVLKGEGAHATLNGLMLLKDREHADTKINVSHDAPGCTSRQHYRAVLDGQARGIFNGKIAVAPHAQKTDGHQVNRALLLSDQAEMDAKPELEIYADDVKCSHGTAIGDLDQNALFYLRSRGLNETEARTLLIDGFVSEILDEIPIDIWRTMFQNEIQEAIR